MADNKDLFSEEPTLPQIQMQQRKFAEERNWDQYHTPRNLLMALVGEVGELAEIFQWKDEVKEGLSDFTEAEREHVGQELSDVFLYLIRLSEKCHVDLPKVTVQKIQQNGKKYPVKTVYGKSDKYTEYNQTNGASECVSVNGQSDVKENF